VIANADHPITEGFAVLIKEERHEWKLQLELLASILQVHRLFGKHVFTSGESCTSTWIVQQGQHRFNTARC
jgi:hypothetical protein